MKDLFHVRDIVAKSKGWRGFLGGPVNLAMQGTQVQSIPGSGQSCAEE